MMLITNMMEFCQNYWSIDQKSFDKLSVLSLDTDHKNGGILPKLSIDWSILLFVGVLKANPPYCHIREYVLGKSKKSSSSFSISTSTKSSKECQLFVVWQNIWEKWMKVRHELDRAVDNTVIQSGFRCHRTIVSLLAQLIVSHRPQLPTYAIYTRQARMQCANPTSNNLLHAKLQNRTLFLVYISLETSLFVRAYCPNLVGSSRTLCDCLNEGICPICCISNFVPMSFSFVHIFSEVINGPFVPKGIWKVAWKFN